MTAREEVERLMGRYEQEQAAKTAKVGKRYYAASAHPPSHWPKTLKALAKWMLIVVVMSMAAGFIVGVVA
jgi:hypothetical protein